MSPVFRKGLYEYGVSRRKIDDFSIGEGRKGKVENESEREGQSQVVVVEVTHVWASD